MPAPRHVAILLFVFLIAASADAQVSPEASLPEPGIQKPIRFEALTQADGIRQTTVTSIIQDRDGFLWFGHEAGVDRYDGYGVKSYSSAPYDSTSIGAGTVWSMIEGEDGALWIGSGNTRSRYDRATDSFARFPVLDREPTGAQDGSILALFEDEEGRIWAGTHKYGLRRLDAERPGHFEAFEHDSDDPTSISHNTVVSLFEDRKGRLWAGTGDGLDLVLRGDTVRFERRTVKDGANDGTMVSAIVGDPVNDDVLWLGTFEGLIRFDVEEGVTARYLQDEVGDRPVTVSGITQDPTLPHVFWIATGYAFIGTGYGIVRLDTRTGEHRRYKHDPNDPYSIAANDLFSIYTDRSGIVWAGAKSVGVARFDPSPGGFIHYRHIPGDETSLPDGSVWGLAEDGRGGLWATVAPADRRAVGYAVRIDRSSGVATSFRHAQSDANSVIEGIVTRIFDDSRGNAWLLMEDGRLNRYDASTGRVRRFKPVPGDNRPIWNMQEDAAGRLWFSYGNTSDRAPDLVRFDPATERFTSIDQGEEASNGLTNATTLGLVSDRDGTIWVATTDGLYRFDDASETFAHYARVPEDTGRVANAMRFAQAGIDGSLWGITTEGGHAALARFDPATETWTTFAHDPADPTTFYMQSPPRSLRGVVQREVEPEIVWIMSASGMLRLDLPTGTFKHYTRDDGLIDDMIYAVLQDGQGRFWMSSNSGLHVFDPDTDTFADYDVSDGLQANEFNGRSAYKSPRTGEMFFGGINGITAFHPDQIAPNATPPAVQLTDFKVFNQSVKPAPGAPLERPISLSEKITLAHHQKSLAFDFVGLHFKNSAKNRYRYRLKGFDSDWIDAGTQRTAAYTNLDPGDYTFEVMAANSDGVWNETPSAVQLAILPPWWRTNWAYGLYVLLFASAVFAVDRVQRRRLVRKERERAAIEQAELRAAAAEAQANENEARAEAVEAQAHALEAQARALEAENESRKNVELLSRIGRTITASLSTEEIVETVYESVNDLMDASIFGVGIYDASNEMLAFPAMKEKGVSLDPFSYRLDDPNRLASWCFRERKEIVIHSFEDEATKYIAQIQAPVAGEDPESILYVPLVNRDNVVGVITAQSFRKDAYDEHDVNVLRSLATYVAIALDNAEAYRRLHATVDELNETLSRLKSAQTQLVTQEKLASLGSLTAGIAHEMKNPLNFVNNFAEVTAEMARELADELRENRTKKVADILDDINEILTGLTVNATQIARHGKRADRIVKNMMEHAHGGQGERYPVDINAFVDEYVNMAYHGVRAQRPELDVDVERDFDDDTGSLEIAPQEMGRVVIKLMNNAFDAVDERMRSEGDGFTPRVHVQTRRAASGVEIRVEDNGPGIPPETAAKIFEPFFTTKPAGSGTGLGLSLSFDIVVHRHGGRLEVEESSEGGAAFVVTLNGAG